MRHFLRSLVTAAIYYGVSNLVLRRERGRKMASRMIGSLGLMLGALVVGYVAFIGLAGTIFFYLAGYIELGRPALITTIILGAIAALLFFQGKRVMDQK